jgi:hypothetical protein
VGFKVLSAYRGKDSLLNLEVRAYTTLTIIHHHAASDCHYPLREVSFRLVIEGTMWLSLSLSLCKLSLSV